MALESLGELVEKLDELGDRLIGHICGQTQ
jgi:hypothetical protein